MHLIEVDMGQAAPVTFVEAEDTLLVKALDTLTIGLINWCTERLVQADLTRGLTQRLPTRLTFHACVDELLGKVHKFILLC